MKKDIEQTIPAESVEQTTPPPKSSRIRELYLEKYPDAAFDDDEQFENAFAEDYKKDRDALQAFREDNQKIFEIMNDNPELGAIMAELAKGAPFMVALAKTVDLEELIPMKEDEDYQQYAEATNIRKNRRKEIEERNAAFLANQEATAAEAAAFFEENGVSQEDSDGLVEFVDAVIDNLTRGKLDKGTIKKLYQAYKYDESVAQAEEAGRIAGRNEKIEVRRVDRRSGTDGLPESRGAEVNPVPKQKRKIIDFDNILNRR